MRVARRVLLLCGIAAVAMSALGARCIENVAVRTDGAGNTYLLGEIYNDTDVQGVNLTVHATLFDGAHNVIASKDTLMCPANLQPHGLSAYAVKFDEPNLQYASYEVRPVAGTTLSQPLPQANVQLEPVVASFFTEGSDAHKVQVTLKVKNAGTQSFVSPQICSVTYDAEGKVRQFTPLDPKLDHADTTLAPNKTTDLSFALRGQVGATSLRVWVWLPDAGGTATSYQPLMTDAVPIAP